MKQYMLSVHGVEGQPLPPADEMQQIYKDVDAFNEELKASGRWVFAGGLHPATTATVVRAGDGGDVITTDGPLGSRVGRPQRGSGRSRFQWRDTVASHRSSPAGMTAKRLMTRWPPS